MVINPFPVGRGEKREAAFSECKLSLITAVGIHSPNVGRACAVGTKKHRTVVGRSDGGGVVRCIVRQLSLLAAIIVDAPNFVVA